MSNDLTVINENDLDEFASSVGADDVQGGGNYLPTLKVNYLEENPETKKELKKGLFLLTGQGQTVYAKTATIRPLLQYFQWTKYSDIEKKTTNRTIFIASFKEEARDESGTIRCGKPPSKDLKDNKVLAKQFEDITCYRHVYALVSYDGVDEDGNKHSVKDVLATLRLKGSNFMPFQDEFIKKMPAKTRLWDWSINLGVTREKNDPTSANSFYVVHFDGDFRNKLPMNNIVFETLKGIKDSVDEMNREIEKKHYNAIKSKIDVDNVMDALDITPNSSDLSDDLIDLPI